MVLANELKFGKQEIVPPIPGKSSRFFLKFLIKYGVFNSTYF